jgi:CrcB protein
MTHGFPWATLVVNVIGCFLFGLIWSLAESRWAINNHVRVVVFTGFLGAFTTFSTYAFEAGQMLRDAQWLYLAIHVLAQNGLGLAAILLGFALGRGG